MNSSRQDKIETLSDLLLQQTSGINALRTLGTAAYTLYCAPEHRAFHIDVAERLRDKPPIQLQSKTPDEVYFEIIETGQSLADTEITPTSDTSLMRTAGFLIQFSDYVPSVQDKKISYEPIASIHESICDNNRGAPSDLPAQFGIALKESDGDMLDALCNLFLASRLYARWLDSSIFHDLPDYSDDEIVAIMERWSTSVSAFKPPNEQQIQDSSGDTYYAWTHALAKFAYMADPFQSTRASRSYGRIFHHGTTLMHNLVHAFKDQSIKSNHAVAAMYGNAIGQACVDLVKRTTPASDTARSRDS